MTERWLPVVGWEGRYEVSDTGLVRSIPRQVLATNGARRSYSGRLLSPWRSGSGHIFVNLSSPGTGQKNRPVHQLVLEAFIGPRPTGLMACHNDGDKSNNTPMNLRWDTAKANVHDSMTAGTHSWTRLTHCKRGHELTPENTYPQSNGQRRCRACNLQAQSIRKKAKWAKIRADRAAMNGTSYVH